MLEIIVSDRNLRILRRRGGRECHPHSWQRIAVLHAMFQISLWVESYPWHLSWNLLTQAPLAILILLQVGRFWCMASLGDCWNTRIAVVPGAALLRLGPYRWLRHPNYLIVVLEFALLPLLLRSPWTGIIFFPLNLLLLRQRIRFEESALRLTATDEKNCVG